LYIARGEDNCAFRIDERRTGKTGNGRQVVAELGGPGTEFYRFCVRKRVAHPIHESLPGVKQDFFFFPSFVFLLITFCCIENYLLFMLSIILGRFGRP
jgi:hypothetical protein